MIEILLVAVPLVVVWTLTVRAEQAQRVRLLASYLGRYRIEKLMEALSEGYLRALAEKDVERQRALWSTLSLTEANLLDEFNRFVVDMSGVWAEKALVSRIPQAVPRATLLFPRRPSTFARCWPFMPRRWTGWWRCPWAKTTHRRGATGRSRSRLNCC